MAVGFAKKGSADQVLDLTAETMSSSQRQLESGGQQLDKNGKPLVGRYRDGTTPAKGKEAYGVSQMQIGTARRTAQKHGIAWDEQKFLYDKGYNATLGDKHMDDLRKAYNGDETLALAAYHSGEPAVNRALAKHGRAAFTNGLGPEGRNYVKKLAGEGSGSGGGGGGGSADMVLESVSLPTASPEVYAQFKDKERTYEVSDPFVDGVTAGMRTAQVADALKKEGEVLEESSAIQQRIQDERLENLQDTVATKKELLGQAENVTNIFSTRYRELVNHREAVQAKEDELANMNPIQKFFKRVTDPKYRRSTIETQNNIFKREVKDAEDDWKTGMGIVETNINVLNQSFAGDDSISVLESQNAAADVQLAEQTSIFKGKSLDQVLKAIQTQTGIDSAQDNATNDLLNDMTDDMVQAGLNAAKAGGGETIIQGVRLTEAQLKRTADARLSANMSLDSQQLALQNGKLNLADNLESKAIEDMTPEMRSKALADGGLWNGRQLNVGKLATAVARDRAVVADTVERAQVIEAPARLGATIKSLGEQVKASTRMLGQAYGYVPQRFTQYHTKFVSEMNAIDKALEAGTKAGIPAETAARLQPVIDKLQEEYRTVIDEAAKDFGGSNKSLQAVGKAWFTGAPLAPQEGANAIIAWSQSGMPAGVVATGETKELLNQVGKTISAMAKRNGGKIDLKTMQPAVMRMLGEQVSNMRLQRVLDNIPALAGQMKSPLRRISKQDFGHAFELGDAEGLEAVADELGLSVEEAQAKAASDPKLAKAIMAAQTQSTMRYLDATFGGPDFVPSQEMAKLFSDEKFMDAAHAKATAYDQGSLPDFVVTQVAGPDFRRQLGAYGNAVLAASGQARKQAMKEATLDSVQLRNNPYLRTQFILNSVPGVSKSEKTMLLDYMQRAIPGMKKEYKSPTSALADIPALLGTTISSVGGGHGLQRARGADMTGVNGAGAVMDKVTALMNTKIEDPQLESIRKRVAGDWLSASELLTRGFTD